MRPSKLKLATSRVSPIKERLLPEISKDQPKKIKVLPKPIRTLRSLSIELETKKKSKVTEVVKPPVENKIAPVSIMQRMKQDQTTKWTFKGKPME
jgi:hypothetical protein